MESYQNMIIIIFLVQNFYFTVFWQKKYYHKNKNHQWQSISNLHRYHNILAAFFFLCVFIGVVIGQLCWIRFFPFHFAIVLFWLCYHIIFIIIALNWIYFISSPHPKIIEKTITKNRSRLFIFLYWLPQNKWNWLLAVMRLRLFFAFFSFNISFTKKKSRMRLNDGKSIRLSILLNVSWFNLDEKKQKIW